LYLFIFAAAVCLTALAYAFTSGEPTYCNIYRLTMTVEVDGKDRSASTVIAPCTRKLSRFNIDNPNGAAGGIFGDALFLDLSPHGNVVATLLGQCGYHGPGEPMSWPFWASPPQGPYCRTEAFHLPAPRTQLHSWNTPVLATFHDINIPTSVEVVDPAHFEAVFGPDVHLKGVYVETTDDHPQRSTIADLLPFLKREPWAIGTSFVSSKEEKEAQKGKALNTFDRGSFVINDCGRNCSWIKNGASP
jgi:hypothetical protein